MKIAFVHDWLIGMRGGEKVLGDACELFPEAEIYTLLHRPERVSAALNARVAGVSWLNSIPGIYRYYRYLLPLMPAAVESFDLSGYDLVISFSHCVAKGARVSPRHGGRKPLHVCYCHTPMRYVYGQFNDYFADGSRSWLKAGAALMRPFLVRWDRRSSRSVDSFLANSENVRGRIRDAYGRESSVIYPGVETEFFTPALPGRPEAKPYYLIATALVPYKRVDLAIEACRELGARLKVVGVGTERPRLEALARGADVEFLGWQSDEALRDLYRGCEAFLFPADEDFGIAPVEAMACGRPVVAYKKGGSLETVRDGVTGVFFEKQTPAAMVEAMKRARAANFDSPAIRAHAVAFDSKRFQERFAGFVRDALEKRAAAPPPRVKVFLILECGSPHGVGHQVAMIARSIDRKRFDVRVIYAVRPGFTAADFEAMTSFAGGHVHIPEMVQPISPLKDMIAFWKLYRLMRREKPDVVHAESSKAGGLARAAAWLAGVPRVYYSPHGYSFLQTNVGLLGRAFYWSIEKSLSWIGNIIASSEGEVALARRLSWGSEVYRIRNLFVPEDIPKVPTRADRAIIIGALGRLTYARNPEAFVRLGRGLAARHPNVRFIWIGSGELSAQFEELVDESGLRGRFELTGHLPRRELLEKLASLDVFVHFSLWEGAPIAINEAMSFGKPVVASNIAGNTDLVVPGKTGFLASNEGELFEFVSQLVESRELREKLGRGGKDFIASEVSLEKSMRALEKLYSS